MRPTTRRAGHARARRGPLPRPRPCHL